MEENYIGRYKIIRELGQGGMATVYLAYDPNMGREVALKVIQSIREDNPQYIVRFAREIDAIKNLTHSAIVPIYDAQYKNLAKGQKPYLVMQYLSGGSLADKLQHGAVAEIETVNIINRIAPALDSAHKEGIIHRDIKPANILFNEHGEAYLADFGIVKLLEDNDPSISRGSIGTPAYMSPEQSQNLPVDERTDIYALGITLFEMLTGEPADTFLLGKNSGNMPSVQTYNDLIKEPLAYDEIINKATANERDSRYKRAGDFAQVVNAAADSISAYFRVDQAINASPDFTENTRPPPSTKERELPHSTQKSFAPASTVATSNNKRNVLVGLGVTLLVLSALLVGRYFLPPTNVTAEPTLVANLDMSVTETTVPEIEKSTEQPVLMQPVSNVKTITVIDEAKSAIWQSNEQIDRIPADGEITLNWNEPVLIQSSSEPLEISLPDRNSLFLDLNTIVELVLRSEEEGIVDIALQQGRILLDTAVSSNNIYTPFGLVALQDKGSLGVEIATDSNQLIVDCLTGTCLLEPINTDRSINLDSGRSAHIESYGSTQTFDNVRSNLYTSLISQIPTATPIPSLEPTATTTPTDTATATLTPTATSIAIDLTQTTQEIGRSVNDIPLELVQLSQGEYPVLFVGGIHAGYAPNSVALIEEATAYFQANPAEIPANIALYVIPNLNPDSSEAPGALMGRLNANGVDLNRNWDCRWQPNNTILGEFVEFSGGSAPVSEPEAKALYQVVAQLQPKAVLFWGAGNRSLGMASPGACEEYSLVSAPLSYAYGRASGLDFVDNDLVEADPNLHGDVTNWLDKENIPAIFIILSRFSEYNWQQELAGIQAVFALIPDLEGGNTAVPRLTNTSTPATCANQPDSRWQTLWAQHQNKLGCAINTVQTPAAAYQSFDQGMMVWREDTEQVYVMGKNGSVSVHTVNDPALAGYYDTENLKGAFGYLWNTQATVRDQLGNPLYPEQIASDFAIQDFANGTIFYFTDNGAREYALTLTSPRAWLNP